MRLKLLLYSFLFSTFSFAQNIYEAPVNGLLTITDCNGILYDSGGAENDYSVNTEAVIHIQGTAGDFLELTFTQFDLENNFDNLFIIAGDSTSGQVIGNFTGNELPNNGQVIQVPSLSATIVFQSDFSINEAGFAMEFSCQNVDSPPIAEATFPSLTCNGTVNFSDNSSGFPTSWAWDFGDGNTSTEQNPIHTYSSDGNYSVQLIACNLIGCDTFEVVDGVTFDADNFICNNGVNMPNEGTESTQDCSGVLFDAGGPENNYSNNSHAQFLIAPPGATSISLTFTEFDLGSDGEHTDMLYIYDGESYFPLASYFGGSLPNTGQTITFNASSINLIFTSNFQNTFSGFAVFWEANGSSELPVAAFEVSETAIAFGEAVSFTDQSENGPGIWFWDFGDGNTSTEQNPTHIYNQAGTFEVTFVASNCIGSDTTGNVTISVQEAPVITIDPDSINITLNAGESNTPSVTICNDGTGDLILDLNAIGDGSGIGYVFGFLTNENGTDFSWALLDTDYNVIQQSQQSYAPNQLYQESIFGLEEGNQYVLALYSPEGIQALESFTWYDSQTGSIIYQGFFETGPEALFILPYPIVPSDPNAGNSVDWLSIENNPTTITPGTCETYDLTIDASDLNGGVYNGAINIYSNDPSQNTNSIPVTLTVIGTPSISVSPTTLDFGDVQVGATVALDFEIENNGSDDLFLSGINSTNPAFVINSTDAFDLAPGESQLISVEFSPSSVSSSSTSIDIVNNAGDNVTVSFQGNGIPAPHITVDPTSFTLELVAGEDSTLIVNVGNLGAADLDFTATSSSDGTGFDFTFTTDFWVDEFSWTLTNAQGEIVESSEGSNYEAFTTYTVALTGLSPSESYTLNMLDSFGDGALSDYSVTDRASGQLVISGSFPTGFDELVDIGSPTEGGSIVSPSQGVVSINGSQELSIDISTEGLSTGTYEYVVTVLSNDPQQPSVDVNITLFVIAPVNADFVAQELVCGSLPIQFTDLSANVPTSWTWDFGDGTTSTEQNPVHTYAASGTYTVSLSACNSLGCDEITLTDYILVDTECYAQNIPSNHGTETITVCEGIVYDSGGPNGNYIEGNFSSLVIAPPGAESVSITFSEFNYEEHADLLYVYDGDQASGNFIGSFTGTELTGQTLVATSGILTLVEYTDHFVNLSGFVATFSCSNDPVAPIANFTVQSDSVLCINEPILFFDQSTANPNQWFWDFGNGAISNEQNPIYQYFASGIYNISLTACNDAGCDTYIETIEVNVDPDCLIDQIPNGNFPFSSEIISNCAGALYDSGGPEGNYVDNNLGVVTIYQSNVSITFFEFDYEEEDYVAIYDGLDTNAPLIGFYSGNELPENGNAIVASGLGITILEFTSLQSNASGFLLGYACPNSGGNAFQSIQVTNPEICDGVKQFSTPDDMLVDSWNWNFGDNTNSTEANPEHEFPHAGMFEVSLEACYQGTCDEYSVMVYSNKLVPEIIAPEQAMPGEEVHFHGTTPDATHWTWDFGNGETTDHHTPSTIYEEPGSYDVHVHLVNMNVHETCDANHTHTITVSEFATNTTELENEKISIYPNPANNFVQVDFSQNLISEFEVQVISLNGQLLKSELNQNRINTEDLVSGTYILQVIMENKSPQQFKVMIQR